MSTAEPLYIIAIGASAGGLEEINSFFDHTPMDGVSYVIIQHLSADFKSRMVDVLDKHSKLTVQEAENGMKIQSNKVYLIPNDKFMTVKEHKLYLTDKEHVQIPHLTINIFFNSLAEDCGKKAIGIILSGYGSDGTEGVKAIKQAGGMVIARNPDTTDFGSMPSNAIASGAVDFVLEPESMPKAIEDYVKFGGELLAVNKDDEKNITAIISLIKEKSPLDFSDYKQTTILRRTKRRSANLNFASLGNYLTFLKKTPEEVDALAKEFLIGVTSFFRDKEAFHFIQTDLMPKLLETLGPDEELKMWVAGCATGEEAYSMAILVAEQLEDKNQVVKIFATDIDSISLAHAGKGIYSSTITKSVSAERLKNYFIKEGDNYRIKPEIRKMLIFAQHDLVKNPPYCNMHFISCRNLLIYMTPVLQKKIYTMLLFGLKMNGYLFLGSSENPLPIITNLEVIHKKWKIYKNQESKRTIRFDSFSLPELLDIKQSPAQSQHHDSSKNTTGILTDEVNSALVDELGCLVICVDEYNQVIKSYGDTTKYLLQKNFNSNLAELLPKPLSIAFNTLRVSALKTNKKVSVSGIKIKHGKAIIKVSLYLKPLIPKKGGQKFLMATFIEDQMAHQQPEGPEFDEKVYLNQYTQNIEDELKELKDKLFSTYEQLDSSNENMQSFNEELLSANEEMQSTNEEMQSVNEELDTINSNYQVKNRELLEMNDDLNNYFRSNINGQLFIDNNLLLMKFSPAAVKQINLLETDVGRPISNISTNIKFETILEDIKMVLATGNTVTKEIETNNGLWYQVLTMPYIHQADNKRSGAIITFNDITELKKTQLELDKNNQILQRINADLDNFVLTASHDLLAPLANIELSISVMNEIKVIDPHLRKFLNIINLSIKQFRTLINDISAIAKMESSTVELVDIDELVDNIEWSLIDHIKLSGAVIKREFKVKEMLFSKKNLRSILYNLISNSIKFKSDQSPLIQISTRQEEEYMLITIEDNGIGMPEDKLDTIFSKYGRLHQNVDGQGIGLFLAKKIIDAAKGNIIVESKPGKGSKFSIYLAQPENQPTQLTN